jgi:hypothetical protein
MIKSVMHEKYLIMPGKERHLKHMPTLYSFLCEAPVSFSYISGAVFLSRFAAASHYGIPYDDNTNVSIYVSYKYDDGET